MKMMLLFIAFFVSAEDFQLFEQGAKDERYEKLQMPLYDVLFERAQHGDRIEIDAYNNSMIIIDNAELNEQTEIPKQFSKPDSQIIIVCGDGVTAKSMKEKLDNNDLDIQITKSGKYFAVKAARKEADKSLYPLVVDFLKDAE